MIELPCATQVAHPCYSGGMVDAGDLKSPGCINRTGSSPVCSSLKISGMHQLACRLFCLPSSDKTKIFVVMSHLVLDK